MAHVKDLQEQLGSFLGNPTIGLSLAAGLAANTALWAMLGLRIGTWPAEIPLHYTIYFGIDLLGPWYRIFFLPAFGLTVLLVNGLLALLLFGRERTASYFLIVSSGLIQLIVLLAGVHIIGIE